SSCSSCGTPQALQGSVLGNGLANRPGVSLPCVLRRANRPLRRRIDISLHCAFGTAICRREPLAPIAPSRNDPGGAGRVPRPVKKKGIRRAAFPGGGGAGGHGRG